MNILIIEDEELLASQLKALLLEIDPKLEIKNHIGSVSDALSYLSGKHETDLIFMDIYLSDGLAFDIFKHIHVDIPIIFCTAYDNFAIKAFEVNSIDYLLKPPRKEILQKALWKYRRYFQEKTKLDLNEKLLSNLTNQFRNKQYKSNFLIPYKDRLIPLHVDDISYFQVEYGLVKCITKDKNTYTIDQSLDSIESQLNPDLFFRVNRQYLIKREAITDVEFYFHGRLLLNLKPKTNEKVLISKARANEFKNWMSENI